MTAEQRTLSGYKSKVYTQEDFKNLNEGKPLLNDSDEYVFKLIKEPHVITRPQKKKNKQGEEITLMVDKAVCEFEESVTKNIVAVFFRIDSLNFAKSPEEEPFESAVIKFFKKIKSPLPEDPEIEIGKHLVVGMRFRSRVVLKPQTDSEGNVITKYYMDLPTARKLLPSDTVGEDFEKQPTAPTQTSTETGTSSDLLAVALKLVQGCVDAMDATNTLFNKNAKTEVVQAFLAANKDGKIKYPITQTTC